MSRCRHVGRRDLAGIDQELREGVIAGESVQGPGAQQVGARVADMGDQQIAAETARGGQRRAHAAQRRVAPARVDEERPHCLDALSGPVLQGSLVSLVRAEDPVRRVEGQGDERRQRHPARHFARRVAAHAVRHDQHVVHFLREQGDGSGRQARHRDLQCTAEAGDEVVILVVGAAVAGVRLRVDVDADT